MADTGKIKSHSQAHAVLFAPANAERLLTYLSPASLVRHCLMALAHEHDRHRRQPRHLLGIAAHHHAVDAAAAMGAQDDQVAARSVSLLNDEG